MRMSIATNDVPVYIGIYLIEIFVFKWKDCEKYKSDD